jgi:hypothetical protein
LVAGEPGFVVRRRMDPQTAVAELDIGGENPSARRLAT